MNRRKCPYRHEDGTCDIDGCSCSGNSPSKCRNRSQLICPNAASWEQEYIALGEVKTYRPIHKILSDGNNGLPGCVDVCEKVTAKLLEAGFPRKALGLDEDELDHTRILKALDDIAVVRKDPNFTKTHRNERVLWCILEEDAQSMAEKILGRRLTLDELRKVKRALEYGLEDWWIALETAIKGLEG